MDKKQSLKKDQKKQERIVHKGIYISNQRRKGPGGRIKCDKFQFKIQINDFNPALHQSQVQWVQIRRYVRGQKRQKQTNNKNKKPFQNNKKNNAKKYVQNKNDKNNSNLNKNDKKQQKSNGSTGMIEKIQNGNEINKNTQEKAIHQKTQNNLPKKSQNLFKKFLQKKAVQNQQKQLQSQQLSQNKESHVKKEQEPKQNLQNEVNQVQQPHIEKQQIEERNQDQIETQSDNDDQQLNNKDQNALQIVKKQQAVVVLKKVSQVEVKTNKQNQKKSQQKQQVETQRVEKQKRQQIIVARILKQTKIVYKEKRFVGILTCQKKRDIKNSFIQKDIKPINKICQDYYLDVTPIHSRLPKMELDNLVPQNLNVLTEYIQKNYPQKGTITINKGKQLTKKKLNQILDLLQSIYVVVQFGLWQKNRPYANIHQVIGND